jgi:diguanylate cyclase (GGDEF)-like protein
MRANANPMSRASLVSVGLLVVFLGIVAARACSEFILSTRAVNRSTAALAAIHGLRVSLRSEGAIPGDKNLPGIQPQQVLERLERVAQLTRDNPQQQAQANEFRALVSTMMVKSSAMARADAVLEAEAILEDMLREEYTLLGERSRQQAQATLRAAFAVTILCLTLLLIGVGTTLATRREVKRRKKAETILESEKQELTRYTNELALVATGSELIQTAVDEAQISAAVARTMRDLLPTSHGYMGLLTPAGDRIEVLALWGGGASPDWFAPEECAALRLGRMTHRSESADGPACSHVGSEAEDSLCVPVRGAHGPLGVLHVATNKLNRNGANAVALFAAQVALGLTNLRMRETLRTQSLRDSLTGLFNRRYFDETLERELAGFRRDGRGLCVLMFDVDHFKQYNDRFGHVAGDDALRTFGRILRGVFRQNDVLCRYGGEEFAAILLHTEVEIGYAKAESFRKLLEETDIASVVGGLERITTSAGVASCRGFGDASGLVRAADAALYEAKRQGRNRTCVSEASADRAAEQLSDPSMWRRTDTSLLNLPAETVERADAGHSELRCEGQESGRPSTSASHSALSEDL